MVSYFVRFEIYWKSYGISTKIPVEFHFYKLQYAQIKLGVEFFVLFGDSESSSLRGRRGLRTAQIQRFGILLQHSAQHPRPQTAEPVAVIVGQYISVGTSVDFVVKSCWRLLDLPVKVVIVVVRVDI